MALGSNKKKVSQRLWRPDFREVSVLPDTKVIRTGFLINFVAISIALLVVTIYVIKEYSLQSLTAQVRELQSQVADNTASNRSILDTNKRFKQSSSIMEEVIAFDQQLLEFPLFIKEITLILPQRVILSEIQMKSAEGLDGETNAPYFSVDLKGRILAGSVMTPSQVLSNFQDEINKLPSMKGRQIEMDLVQFRRNNEQGYFDFTLELMIPPEKGSKS
ncbi:hypothetical protein G0Q06_08960 [Puniceicoccales bacterium CK1056]|uniref:Uncharacterized protein n=1 Tax=Oceanipulchritudo coccoides TaxID=2706888 RepID=A0A6B2M304_9BACT|nr:hypothetical protein [Oceanipulchritudo coccoides]NDV62579.1 hypothetical protein [Oceanipulchritudo coccoides]